MQAMDPAAADLYEEDGKDLDFYDFEPLPTLPEDEENVSLADILSLRDRGLSEQEAWAVCLECSLSMRSVAHAAIFQSLCITPDTLAFNTSGNVCFMEQLSDDPEGAFVPPEFDVTGNTFEAHIYSLGATLKAALEYVAEPTLEPRLSQDLEALLSRMQAEDPRDRPDLESIIALCEEKLQLTSSCRVCRSLSAVGRRVLSIESFGALQDVSESSWRDRPAPGNTGPRRPPGDPSTDPEVLPTPEGPESETSRGPRASPTKALLSTPVKNGESHSREGLAGLVLDAERTLGELDRDTLRRSRLRKVQTFPRLLSDSPEATLCLPLTRGKSQLPMSELFSPDPRRAFLDRKNGLSSFQAQPKCRLWPEQEPEHQLGRVPSAGRSADRGPGVPGSPGQPETSHPSQGPAEARPPPCPADPQDASGEAQTPGDDERIPEGARQLETAAVEKWVSLQDLLSQLGRPFREYELWALCLACLRALQTHPEHPAYLCLDSVLVAEDGAVLFQPPPANGSYDSFFLAPELAEERLVTEKASVYCVAAVLWTAAKFSIPRNHKLALPRRLKTLLLDMARRSAPERPSVAEAIKVCGSYLLQRGMDSRKILAHLRASICQVYQEEETISLQNAFSVVELKPSVAPAPEPSPGFLLVNSDTGLVAVPGPVPGQHPCSEEATQLPAAFTSEATHFKPIVLAQDTSVARDQPALAQEESEERGGQREGEGEYIFALKDLTFATFCGAISEKFCDLYWDEKLLQNLFKVVNGQASPSPSTAKEAGSQLEGSQSPRSPSSKRPSLHRLGKEKPAMARTSSRAPCSPTSVSDVDSDALSRGNFEVGFRPQRSVKTERAQQPEAGEDRRPAGGASDVEAVTRLARSKGVGPALSPGPAGFQSCSPGWCSAFYEADCFGADVHNYVKDLGRQQADGALPDAQSPELEQQLMMEKRNYRKTLKFYQKLLQKEKRNKGSDVKTMLSKLKGQLEEMKSRVQFLSLVKKYLQVMYAERWGLEPCALPVIVNIAAAPCDTLDFSPLDESSSLIFYNVNKHPGGRQKARILQAGTPLGLMAYLYSSDAFLEGYVQQFLYTFRYFCTPHDFLHFLLDRINSTLTRAHQDPTSTFSKIYRRSLCVLQAWVEDCYAVDFPRNSGLLGKLEDFISSKILPLDGSAKHLLSLLEVGMDRRAEGSPRGTDLENPREAEEDARPFNALCKRLSEDGISRKSFPWRLPRGNGLVLPPHKERPYTIAAALPKPCFLEDFYGPCAKTSEKGPYFLTEYSTHQLFSQLTLLQQELFQKCHPVHFLNSRALGVMDKSTAIPKASSSESLSAKTCSLFLPNYVQDKYLLQLLRNSDDVSTWVAAEIVTSHTSKLQVNLLSKFLLIAKSCYEQRNFATAMQILSGLEHPAVRQSPAWRILPAKIAEVMEELKAVEVFLKSDSLCLMEGRRFRAQPTLPSAHLLAMHIQQLETGGFTMTNGAHRWSKLRNIAKVVSQVHAFQENPYTFSPDPKLQSYLKQRIAQFSGADISTLAADSRANFHQVSGDKHSRKIQDKLRRMKATFQ
ncbi:kinase non-catalytic C-lobe domain-containing protein 1 isoform X2 [Pongo pygmaeus]|uniref:kinase non-catalytic C-lobe domain-containing protein 1 isoform X2 n=1 Tax=Pongo pygmaeus TaxID=9600 RepID=UPI0023E15E68|nr:kinase non-catalytic C-lobe domain-containing protein 1 isoform X2 [Pongo pygmaeus]